MKYIMISLLSVSTLLSMQRDDISSSKTKSRADHETKSKRISTQLTPEKLCGIATQHKREAEKQYMNLIFTDNEQERDEVIGKFVNEIRQAAEYYDQCVAQGRVSALYHQQKVMDLLLKAHAMLEKESDKALPKAIAHVSRVLIAREIKTHQDEVAKTKNPRYIKAKKDFEKILADAGSYLYKPNLERLRALNQLQLDAQPIVFTFHAVDTEKARMRIATIGSFVEAAQAWYQKHFAATYHLDIAVATLLKEIYAKRQSQAGGSLKNQEGGGHSTGGAKAPQ